MWLWMALTARAGEPETPTGMAGHFQDAALTMLAVAVDDKKEARAHAKALATSPTAPEPLREAAQDLLGDLGKAERAGPAVADLVGACAKCHLAGGRGPEPVALAEIPGASPVDRHVMASMFVWIGLVTPLQEPWDLGLDRLLEPLDTESSDAVRASAETFTTLVHNARAAKSWAERRDKFGTMLPACVECHALTGTNVR